MPWTEYRRFNGFEDINGISSATPLIGTTNTGTVTFDTVGDEVTLKTPNVLNGTLSNISEDIPFNTTISGIEVKFRYNAATADGASFSVSVLKRSDSFPFNYGSIGVNSNISTSGTTSVFTLTSPDNTDNLIGKGFTRDNIDFDIGVKFKYISGEFNLHGETASSDIPLPAIRIYYFNSVVSVVNTSKLSITGTSKLTVN